MTHSDFQFQELSEQHLPLPHEWLLRPHVAERWRLPASIDAAAVSH